MFSRNKKSDDHTVVNSQIGAELQLIESFPNVATSQFMPEVSCRKVRVDGALPNVSFSEDAQVQTTDTGYIVSNFGDGATMVIANTSDFNFKVWKLKSEDDLGFDSEVHFAIIHPDQENWDGYFVLDVACLSSTRLLVAVGYYDPRIKYALYLYDIDKSSFQHLANAEEDVQKPYQFFEHKTLDPGNTLVLYYSARTRRAAELYHNEFNHFVLFTSQYENGVEILKLSIETGNVTNWAIENQTLYLQTLDGRSPETAVEKFWSLDLSNVLARQE